MALDDTNALTRTEVMVAAARRITVLTGAGMSTAAGIPDFRGPNGVWTKNPAAEKASTLRHYLGDPEVRRAAWQGRLAWFEREPRPTRAHRALVRLEERKQLRAVITQNVDGLHLVAGHDPRLVHEVHGTILRSRCWSCGDRRDMRDTLTRVNDTTPDPSCQSCGGILKSDTILFGESLDGEVIDKAMAAAEDCDLFVAIGTTLSVYPVANCVPRAREAGARVIIVNGAPTDMDHLADEIIRGDIEFVVPNLCGTAEDPATGR
ncbi:MAG: SIR2 family NAD-dependent protein deacylase [Ilumatobacteraceae bacterium]